MDLATLIGENQFVAPDKKARILKLLPNLNDSQKEKLASFFRLFNEKKETILADKDQAKTAIYRRYFQKFSDMERDGVKGLVTEYSQLDAEEDANRADQIIDDLDNI